MKRISRLVLIVSAIAFSLTIISIIAYYSFMPVWIYVEPSPRGVVESAGVWRQISDKQLDDMPLLKTAIENANESEVSSNPHYSYIVGASNEGVKISDQLRIFGDARLHLFYKDRHYLLQVVHSYSQPSRDYVPPMPVS